MNSVRDSVAFWSHIEKTPSCWIWTGCLDRNGYGRFSMRCNGKVISKLAHRLIYETERGPIANGLVVFHHCDNPRCVNPEHLTAGTQGENVADAVAKGRNRTPNQKLSDQQKEEIVRLGVQGTAQHTIARDLCISQGIVSVVLRRRGVSTVLSPAVVNATKRECVKGHPFDRIEKDGARGCRRCGAERSRRHWANLKRLKVRR